jgi:hypothetical protein
MTILDRYIGLALARGALLVILVLLPLFTLPRSGREVTDCSTPSCMRSS